MWRRNGRHRKSLRRQIRTARALLDEGALEQAESLMRQLGSDCDDTFGTDAPESIGLLNLLGSALYQQRKLSASAAMHGEAVDRAARVLGRDHPETLGYAHNYGAALAVQGRTPDAVAVLDDTLQRRIRRLGNDHEDSLTTANTLGATLFAAGAVTDGLTVLRQAYAASRHLPGGHELRDDIARNLRIAQRNAGNR